MARIVLALAFTLVPVFADAAMLRTLPPSHFSAPRVIVAAPRVLMSRPGDSEPPRPRSTARAPRPSRDPTHRVALHRMWRSPDRARRTALRSVWPSRAGPANRQPLGRGAIHVHDGDTFYVGAEAIRLRGIDTPEIGQPRAEEATRRLIELLTSGPVTIVRRAEDVYGRIIADVYVGGRNVACVLRAEGYAKPGPPSARRGGVKCRGTAPSSAKTLP